MRTPILDAVIFKKMRALVGGRIRLLLSGGAPLASDTHDFVRCALELPLVQGYGLTESCACGTIMDSDEQTTGRAGPPLQGVQVRLTNWDEGNYKVTDKPRPRGTHTLKQKTRHRFGLKRLLQKELPSRLVGLSFHGLDALSLSLLKIAGTTADKNWRERKL